MAEEYEKCPICHNKIHLKDLEPEEGEEFVTIKRLKGVYGEDEIGEPVPFWTDDPLYTQRGLAGEEYKGKSPSHWIHIRELQNYYKDLEEKMLLEENRTEFLEVKKYEPIRHVHIEQLRMSVEKLLVEMGFIKEGTEKEADMEYYFKYDRGGNEIETTQTDWTDVRRAVPLDEEGEPIEGEVALPLLPKKMPIRAIHIEELRKGVPLLEMERWNICEDQFLAADDKLGAPVENVERYPWLSEDDYAWTGDIGENAWKGSCVYPAESNIVHNVPKDYYIEKRIGTAGNEFYMIFHYWGDVTLGSSESSAEIKDHVCHVDVNTNAGSYITTVYNPMGMYGGHGWFGFLIAGTPGSHLSMIGTFKNYPIVTDKKEFTCDLIGSYTPTSSSVSTFNTSSGTTKYPSVTISAIFTTQPPDKPYSCSECDWISYDRDAYAGVTQCPECEREIIPGRFYFRRFATYTIQFGQFTQEEIQSYRSGWYGLTVIDKRNLSKANGTITADVYKWITNHEEFPGYYKYLYNVRINFGVPSAQVSVHGFLGYDTMDASVSCSGGSIEATVDNIGLKRKEEEENGGG